MPPRGKGKEFLDMDWYTDDDLKAGALTVSLVDEDGNTVKMLKGDAAKKAEAEYMHALEVSDKMLPPFD